MTFTHVIGLLCFLRSGSARRVHVSGGSDECVCDRTHACSTGSFDDDDDDDDARRLRSVCSSSFLLAYLHTWIIKTSIDLLWSDVRLCSTALVSCLSYSTGWLFHYVSCFWCMDELCLLCSWGELLITGDPRDIIRFSRCAAVSDTCQSSSAL